MIIDSVSAVLNNFRALPDYSAFQAFAHALWQNEAAVMVGSGFSRACVRELNSPIPPLWGHFQTEMEAALGYESGKGPDALRLAQEYQTQHGEDGLDRLIRRLVTDDQWEPGKLHEQLLDLPWQDVLTTNWDTLLERTKPQKPDRIYGCIRTVQDIAHQTRPRIVKLHGSLPSHKPFIFTEDEFRTYPSRFDPFVNLTQQVMLENELCLIGFSGVDPNFLAWSGWVRDTLKVAARRIRLVGVLNLSPVSRSLLEARNVTPIDLAPLVQNVHQDEQHEKALELFFDALRASKPSSPFEWNMCSEQFSASHGSPDEEKATRSDVAKSWGKDRNAYPGWLVGPYKETHSICYSVPTFREEEEPDEAHLRFSAERIWRHRVARVWLHLEDMQAADIHFDAEHYALSPSECIDLCASIAAEHRRYQNWDDWGRWMARLEAVSNNEARLSHAYETGQRALLTWDDDAILKASHDLKSKKPIWMMRRAGLLATLFHHKEAAELYQAALLSIRQKLLSAPKSAWLISLEGWAAMFHRVSYSALGDELFAFAEEESTETRLRFLGAKAEPWGVISRLDNLATERIDRNRKDAEPWKLSFKPGRYSPDEITRDKDNECPFYGLLDLLESTGAPENIANFNVFSTRMETAYRAVTVPDEHDLLAFLARYRGKEKKNLDSIMPRMQVARLSDETVVHLLSAIPQRINKLVSINDRGRAQNYIAWLLELLARITIRAQSTRAFEIFEWLIKLLGYPRLWWGLYAPCGKVLEGAIEAMCANERLRALDLAIHLKLPGEAGAQVKERDWPELIDAFSKKDMNGFSVSSQSSARIESLVALVETGPELDRGRALIRLHALHIAGKLTEAQQEKLKTAIWSRRDEVGWPRETKLHPWIFLELPGHEHAETLFLDRIVDAVAGGQIGHELLINLRAGLERSSSDVKKEVLVNCICSCLDWTPIETEGRDKFSIWLLGDTENNLATAREIGEVLARSLLPRLNVGDLPDNIAMRLKVQAATAFQLARLLPDQQHQSISIIRAAISSRDPERVYSAYLAMMQFIKNATPKAPVPQEIKETLLHTCEQRTQPGLSSAIELLVDMVGSLLEDDVARLERALPDILEEYHYGQSSMMVLSMAELPIVRKNVRRLLEVLPEQKPHLKELRILLANDPLPEVRLENPESQNN